MMSNVFGTVLKSCSKFAHHLQSSLRRLYSTAPRRPLVVAVEGNIGSGKTFLLQHFADTCSETEVFMEPVNKWRDIRGHNALGLMYEDPKRWSLTFQTYVQLTMLQTHLAVQSKPVKMMERSIHSAKYCFAENLHRRGVMPDIEYTILTEWFDYLLSSTNCHVDLIVYLRSKPETVFNRVKSRCRQEENSVSLEYLESLHELHEEWLISQKTFPLPAPLLVLDANGNRESMVMEYEKIRHEILCFSQPAPSSSTAPNDLHTAQVKSSWS